LAHPKLDLIRHPGLLPNHVLFFQTKNIKKLLFSKTNLINMSDEAFTKEIVGGITDSYSWMPFIVAIIFVNTLVILMTDLMVVTVYEQESIKSPKSPRFWLLVGTAILAPLTILFVSPFSSMIAFALFLGIEGFFIKLSWDSIQAAKHAAEGKEKADDEKAETPMKTKTEMQTIGAEQAKIN
jgi:phage shock protein PspC (stress-responsive transcriptional regulator)